MRVINSAKKFWQEYQSFTDLQYSKEKTITDIQWHPVIKGKWMVIYDLLTTLIMKTERRQWNYDNMSTCHTPISNSGLTFTSNIQYAFHVLVKVKLCFNCMWYSLVFTGIIAVSCGEGLSFDDRVDNFSRILMTSSLVLIWSFSDPIHPLVSIEIFLQHHFIFSCNLQFCTQFRTW